MDPAFPFDPVGRGEETERQVIKDGNRLYHRFRAAPYYGGVATADAVGCCFLCAYCWNYRRNLTPGQAGTFCSPEEVGSRLLRIAEKNAFRRFRLSGAEPVLGEETCHHLVEVMRIVFAGRPDALFILETNGFFLGRHTELVEVLRDFSRLLVRVCLKGTDPESFEKVTGAGKDFFSYPLAALREMEKRGVRCRPALMAHLFSRDQVSRLQALLRKQGVRSGLELEYLEAYPFVLENMRRRGLRV